MLTYSDGLRALSSDLWAVEPSRLHALVSLLLSRVRAGTVPDPRDGDALQAALGTKPRPRQTMGVGVIPMYGVLTQHASIFSEVFGMSTYTGVGAMLAQAVADPEVGTIVLDVDSPGGQVNGAETLARQVFAAREQKKVIAVANHMMASAAYWVGSAASEVVAPSDAEVGAIGVYLAYTDTSEADAKEGIKREIIASGKFKGEALGGPLTEEARAAIQARADSFYDLFVHTVAQGRGVSLSAVKDGFGEGRLVTAKAAMKENMVDRMDTMDAVIQKALSTRIRPKGAQASIERERLALDAARHLA